MNPKLVLSALVILASAFAWWRLHRALAKLPQPGLRLAAQALLPWVLGPSTILLVVGPIDRGTWQCRLCGALVERTTILWLPVAEGDPDEPDPVAEDARRFENWYASMFGADANHDWRRIGCHRKGWWGGVGCAEHPFRAWYRAMPHVPDGDVARAMMERVRAASGSEREQLLASVRGAPWAALDSGRTEHSREQFLREHAAWLASHPEWQ